MIALLAYLLTAPDTRVLTVTYDNGDVGRFDQRDCGTVARQIEQQTELKAVCE